MGNSTSINNKGLSPISVNKSVSSDNKPAQPAPKNPNEASYAVPKIEAQWEWQSNANPWSSNEELQWTPYNPLDNYLLERAFKNKEDTVDLGDYTIFIKHNDMRQQKKNDVFKQRRVRRNEEYSKPLEEPKGSSEENLRKKRFFGAETPKTYNKAFGDMKHFILFFENRGPEIKNFANAFKEIEFSKDLNRLNQEIVPVLVDSLEKEIAKLTEKQSQEKVVKLFKITFTSFRQFYGEILKAYTVNGFLYKNLNRYLRNEDWIELDCLLPYAFCLCKAFLITELTSTYNNNQKQQLGGGDKIILYRGAILDQISLSFYDGQTIPNFSWNAVTSTTTDRRVAENFMAGNTDPNKIPVMFVIEVPITQDSLKNLSWIDIKPFSVYPIEEEIVLGPGSTFKLTSFSRDKKGAEIHLSLIPRVDTLAHQGQIMHGAMHAKMTTGLISKIVALEGNELMDGICHLKGNRLIEELEFNFCKYDTNTLAKLIEILPTISNLRRLACFSLSSNDKTHMTDIIKGLKQLKIRTLEIYDRSFNVYSFSNEIKHLTSLTDLSLDFTSFEQFSDSLVHDLGRYGIRHLTSLITLSLKFPRQVTGWGLESIAQDLQQLTSLKALNLKFSNREISHEKLMSLFTDALKHLTLETLSLDFSGCLVADKVLSALDPQELKHLQKLVTLNLNFTDTDASNEGLKDFSATRLRYLNSLKVLKLDFTNCEKISNIGVRDLWSEGISYLSSLTTLDLSFKEKRGWITGEGWENLLLNKTKNLSSLTSLNIVFQSCSMREDGMKNFSCGLLKHLTSLTSLSLYFGHTNPAASLGDEEVKILCHEGIRHLASLRSLYLNFKNCRITNQGLGALAFEGIRNLNSLSTLSLNLDGCLEITDEGLKNLCFGGIKYLTALTTLSLSLNWLFRISDEGLRTLCFEGIRYLTSLRMLSLDFSKCPEISDEGLKSLFHDTIPNLASLTTLKLNCDRCLYVTEEFLNDVAQDKHLEVMLGYRDEIALSHNEQAISYNFKRHIKKDSKKTRKTSIESVSPISDKIFTLYSIERLKKINGKPLEKDQIERIKSLKFDPRQYPDDEDPLALCFQGLQDFSSLTNLDLDFHECRGIPDEWFKSLYSEGLRHLTTLTTLKLNLNNCQIQDEGFKSLSEALTHLTSLTTLDLDFSCVYGIDDTVFKDLCSRGIRSLTSLKYLCLNFNSSGDWDMKNLATEGLRYLTALTTLDLSFEDTRLTNAELKDLCTEGIRYLTSLTTLKINYVKEYCSGDFKGLGDIGLTDLCVEGIRHLTSLKSLSLRLSANRNLTDAGLKRFGTEGLRYMTWLTSLDLNFGDSDITSAGLKDLCTEGIRYLTSLTTFKLDLLIDNEGLKAIGSEGIKYLTKLDVLELDMNHPFKSSDISNEGLRILCSEGIRNLVSLTTLKIDFPECKNIDNEGFLILASEGFKHLSSLKTLTLNFAGCYEVKDEGLRSLCAEGIRHLTSLTTLNLRFCSYFTDEGLKNLGTEGIKYLTSLTALDLTFRSGKFTDEGLKSLCTEGIKHLKSLTTLDLTFNFGNLTDEGLKDLCTEGIKYLTSLTTLYLSFENCNKFTEAGYKDLKMLLKYFGFYSLNYRPKHDR